jgi:uncharacterized protein YybS (DUF2232 family)
MSFDNLGDNKAKKLNLVILILITAVILIFVAFVPLFGIIGLALIPVPVTLLVLSGRVRDGVICAVISCIVLFLLDYVLAPVAMILIIMVSFIYRRFIGRDKSKLFIVTSVFSLFCGAALLYVGLASAVSRINFIAEVFKNYNVYVDQMADDQLVQNYASLLSIDHSQLDSVIRQTQDILRFFPYVVPGVLISLFIMVSVINYISSSKILKKYHVDIKPFLSFKEWDLPWYYCWGAITGLALMLIPSMESNIDMIIDIAGSNLLAVFGFLYLALGIAVLWGIFERFKVSIMLRVITLIIVGLFIGFTIFILPFLGLIDIWANFRKLKRERSVQS